MKLYTYPNNPNANKALVAAQYVGADIEVVTDFKMGETNKTPEFLKLNPFGKVPVLETPQGGIFESNAIARYVARLADKGLFGKNAFEAAQIESWIDWSTLDINGPTCSWAYPLVGFVPYDKKKETAAKEALQKALAHLNAHLEQSTYLVGHTITLADIIAFCNLFHGFVRLFSPEFRAPFPCVERYFLTLAHQPAFQTVFGAIELCKEEPKYTPPKKDAAPKEAAKPKAESKPKEAVPKDDAEEEKPAPKAKNPLDLLPPSPMALDSWKRLYSNTPSAKFREIACAGLWNGADIPNSPTNEHFVGFDYEGYSVWFCDYKYTDENTVNYVVMNKVGGFLQRIDYVRKYAFGVMCILKNEKGEFPIRGVWIFRGQEIPPILLEECYDMELYDFKKVDPKDPAVRARMEDMLAEADTIDGLEHVECKVFK